MSEAPKRALVVKLNRLGDTVAFLPTLKALREGWPKTHLTLITTNIGKELLEHSSIVDEIWTADINDIRTFRGFFHWLKLILKNRFDVAIASSDSSSFVSLLLFISFIPVRVGFSNPKLSFLFNRKISFSNEITHLELNLRIAENLGLHFDRERPYPYLSISEGDKKVLLDMIRNDEKSVNISFAVLHIGSNRPSRRWIIKRYRDVVRFLAEKYSMKTVCIGSQPEKALVFSLKAHVNKEDLIDLCGKTNLKQLIYVISLAKLFIGHSSGPLHIAYMVGVPTISLWGASSLAVWGPAFDKEKHICIKADLDCLHCEQDVCPKGTLQCMKLIKTDRVIYEISKLLERNIGNN